MTYIYYMITLVFVIGIGICVIADSLYCFHMTRSSRYLWKAALSSLVVVTCVILFRLFYIDLFGI